MIKFRVWFEESVLKKAHMVDWEELKEFKGLSRLFDDAPHSESFSLMQSTGIKDKNGVGIYVGDIVILTSKSINYADTYWHNYAEVIRHPNGAYRLRGKGMYETELYGNRKRVTLTGNIYEAPELLENDRFCTETDDPNC
ncbi:YopX family protein [Enterococcus dispar]